MTIENQDPTAKKLALAELKQALTVHNSENAGDEEEEARGRAYVNAERNGASLSEIMMIEFEVLPVEARQNELDTEARRDLESRFGSLEHALELMTAYQNVRDTFGLKDPYRSKSSNS